MAMIEKFGTYPVSLMQRLVFRLVRLSILRSGWGKRLAKRLWDLFSISPDKNIYDFERFGVKFRIDFRNNYMERKLLFYYRTPDEEDIRILQKRMSDGDVFLDLGANIGYWSLRLVPPFPNSPMLAFEPNPIIFERLRTNIAINGFTNITALPYAVSDSNGKTKLSIPCMKDFGHDYSMGSINADYLEYKKTIAVNPDVETHSIETRLLLDCVKEQGVKKVDVIKADIEGNEAFALLPYFRKASEEYLPHTVVIERGYAERPYDGADEVLEYLLGNDYEIFYETKPNTILIRKGQ